MIAARFAYTNNIPAIPLNDLQLSTRNIVEEKVKENEYVFEKVPCLVCEGNDFELLAEKDRYGLFMPVVICKSCGLTQTNPRMNQEAYISFYTKEYRKLYNGTQFATEDFFADQYYRGGLIYDFLSKNGFIGNKKLFILEVGCGAGGILKVFRDKGHEVKGIDLGKEYLEYGKTTHGLDLEEGFLANIKLDKKPDLIIYSQVVEHLLNPREELNEIKKIIGKDTLLYIEVPGIKDIAKSYRMDFMLYLQNAHTYHFSLTTLSHLLEREGFTLKKGNEYIRSIFQKSPENHIPSYFPNDYEATMKVLHFLENNKHLYPISPSHIQKKTRKMLIRLMDIFHIKPVVKKILGK